MFAAFTPSLSQQPVQSFPVLDRQTLGATSHQPLGSSLPSIFAKRQRAAWACHTRLHRPCAAFPREDDGPDAVAAAFQRELQARHEASTSNQLEVRAATGFDGGQLLAILQDKFGRSYDVCLVQRQVAGKQFIALNIMWKYREQRSFGLTEDEYMDRLESAAAALRAWGVVRAVKEQVAAARQRPRVGKAVSIFLDVDEQTVRDWFAT